MIKMEETNNVFYILLVFVIILILSTSFLFYYSYKLNTTCEEQGWDGVRDNKCYKTIPHESGMGSEYIYSGEIKLEDIK